MFSLLKHWYQRHFSQPGTIEFAVVLLATFIIIYYFMWLVGPIVVALCLAFCLDWPVERLKRRFGIRREIGSCIVMVIFSSILVSLAVLVVPNVIKQGAEFYNSIVSLSTIDPEKQAKYDQQDFTDGMLGLSEDEATAAKDAAKQAASTSSANEDKTQSDKANSLAASMSDNPAHTATQAELNHVSNTSSKGQSLSANSRDAIQDGQGDPAADNASAARSVPAPAPEGQTEHDAPVAASAATSATSTTCTSTSSAQAPVDADTTIIYISSPEDPAHISYGPRATHSNGNAAAEGHVSNNLVQGGQAHTFTNPEGYQIKVINGASTSRSVGSFNSDDGQFSLTVNDFDIRVAHEINELVSNLPEPMPTMLSLNTLEEAVSKIRVAATNKIADLIRTQFMPSVVNAFTWLVYAIIVPIFTLLMLYNKPILQKRALTFILPNNQQLMRQFWPSMQAQISGYIRGKILHIIIIAAANSLAFMLMGMNYALLLGVGVGLSVVIPYVGAVIIAVPVVLVAVFQFGFSPELLWVLIFYTVIQLLDSNVLTPMLFSKAMNLDAFSILSAILIFGNLWGFWGVFFAIPLATFVKTLIVGWPNNDPHDEFGNPQTAAAAGEEAASSLRSLGIQDIEKNFSDSITKKEDKDRI